MIVNLEWLSELWGYVVGGGADLPDHAWRGLDPDDGEQVARFAREGVRPAFHALPGEQRRRFAATLRYATDYLEEPSLGRYLTGVLPPFATPQSPRAFYQTVLNEAFGGGPDGPFEVYDDLAFRVYDSKPPGPPLTVADGSAPASIEGSEAVPSLPPRDDPESEAALYRAVQDELARHLPAESVEPRLRAQVEHAKRLGHSVPEHLAFLLESLEDPRIDPGELLTLFEGQSSE